MFIVYTVESPELPVHFNKQTNKQTNRQKALTSHHRNTYSRRPPCTEPQRECPRECFKSEFCLILVVTVKIGLPGSGSRNCFKPEFVFFLDSKANIPRRKFNIPCTWRQTIVFGVILNVFVQAWAQQEHDIGNERCFGVIWNASLLTHRHCNRPV